MFANFILPVAQFTAQIIGVQAMHIYALPQDDLIEHYQSFGFHRLPEDMEAFVHEHVKPMYDKRCIFMYLPL